MQRTSIVIYQENQSAIALVQSGQTAWTTKHIEVWFHYIQDKIADRTIQVKYCSTHKMIADKLIKVLAPEQFIRLWHGIMTPKNVANTLGGSIQATMRRRPMRRPLGSFSWAANQRDINKHGDGMSTSLPLASTLA